MERHIQVFLSFHAYAILLAVFKSYVSVATTTCYVHDLDSSKPTASIRKTWTVIKAGPAAVTKVLDFFFS